MIPKGSISLSAHIKESVSTFTALAGTNDQNLAVSVGPYTIPTPALLSSMSITATVGEPVTMDLTVEYFGAATLGSYPSPAKPTAQPLNVDGVSLAGFSQIGGSPNVKSVSWNFGQNYAEHTLLGQIDGAPLIVFQGGTIELNVEGDSMTVALLEAGTTCLATKADFSVTLKGCSGVDYGTLGVTDGYMQSRSATVNTTDKPGNGVSIIQYL
jgi:hypothetical protein